MDPNIAKREPCFKRLYFRNIINYFENSLDDISSVEWSNGSSGALHRSLMLVTIKNSYLTFYLFGVGNIYLDSLTVTQF